jgi:hypothetical protein
MHKHLKLNTHDQAGKVIFKFFLWPSIIISLILSVGLTIILNLIF